MYSTLESLKKLTEVNSTVIDSSIFRLHYKFTVVLLLAFSILVTTKQFVGDPIECDFQDRKEESFIKSLNTFCWIHSTYSVNKAWFGTVGKDVIYPGVDKYTKGDERVFHTYYQWVCFLLFLQAVLFYLPRYLWKILERGKIKALVMNLKFPIIIKDKKDENIKILVDYFLRSLNYNSWFGIQFVFCECLNLINTVGQLFLLNLFFGGEFFKYGIKVIEFSEWNWSVRYDPMIQLFPRMTKCTFYNYGTSGDIQSKNAVCLLPINVLNEKIFIFLWFWFLILSCLTFITVVVNFILIYSQKARFFMLKSRARLCNHDHLNIVLNRCTYSDWLILYLLSKNLDSLNYCDLIAELSCKMSRIPKNFHLKRKVFPCDPSITYDV